MIVIDPEADTVTMSRAEYEALVEAAEDTEDLAHLAAQEERERILGVEAARRDHLPGELMKRMLAGEHPVRLWRERRGLKLGELAARAGVAASYLSEIESGRKPGSVAALVKLARALGLGIDDLVA
ncbi:MAG TPA: helix-turn-helix transcriptional regulator [Geminicoccaceae bacterium]|jgi:ribosome-binding protein aMBF1 (putative translation factor)|nr:helix-turn-helix transcriptional regulator [Geminicoccaceae bacterium]